MTLDELLRQLGDNLARVLLGFWADVQAGRITEAEFTDLATTMVEITNTRGRAAAEAAFQSWAETTTGRVHAVAAVATVDDAARLTEAFQTILASKLDTVMQLERLARNEPAQAATDALADAMARSTLVSGWRRGLEPDACQLCVWWWREGRVWRTDHPMPRHTGCTCTQIPIPAVVTSNYQKGADAA